MHVYQMNVMGAEFWSAILGAIIGGIIAIAGWFIPNTVQRRHERKSVRAALRSEIQSLLAIIERRDYIRNLSNHIQAIRDGSQDFFLVRIAKDYDIVFKNNCDKLGLLSADTAARIVRFYYLISSVVEDLDLFQDAVESPVLQARYGLNTPAGNLFFHEQMLQLSHETLRLGSELVAELA